jgi:hypothetical protein
MIRVLAVFFLLVSLTVPAWAQDVLQPAPRPDWTAPLPAEPPSAPAPQAIPSQTAPETPGRAPIANPVMPPNLTLESAPPAFDPTQVDLSEIPEILLREMDDVQRSCQENYFYSSFHNCECIAITFLDERIKSDPRRSRDAVLTSVQSKCANDAGVAGYVYTGCADFLSYKIPDAYEGVCTCVANRVAQRYARAPLPNIRYVENIRRDAYTECGLGEALSAREAELMSFR